MKTAIHPEYHSSVTITCACGNTFTTGSTSPDISIEVCSNCHPFYTGKSKLVDTAGRVDKFAQRLKRTEAKQKAEATTHKSTKAKKKSASKRSSKIVKLK